LLIDSLESVRIVTGSGEILTASENQNPDLFWGLRGAGHNFGIITNATFKIYPFTNGGQVMSADMRIPVSKNQSIWEFVKSYENNMPDELSIDVAGLYSEQFGGVSGSRSPIKAGTLGSSTRLTIVKQTYFLISITYAGPLSTGTKIIQPLLDLNPLTHNITSIPWSLLETQGRFGVDAEACIKGTNHNVFGINLYKIDVPNLVEMSNYVDEVFRLYPAFRFALFSLSKYATRVIESVPDDATAYPYRNTNAYV